MKRTTFSIGQRFYCDRGSIAADGQRLPNLDATRPNFWFTIVAAGRTPTEKLCLIEADARAFLGDPMKALIAKKKTGLLNLYSHAHLRRYRLDDQTDAAWMDRRQTCLAMATWIAPVQAALARGDARIGPTLNMLESLINGEPLTPTLQALWTELESQALHDQASALLSDAAPRLKATRSRL